MTSLQIANILQFVVIASLWLFIVFGVLPTYRLDSFRQKMFSVRDELFDYAASGKVAFNDPAYMLLRRQMNALIRYGHQVSVFRLLMTHLINRVCRPIEERSWKQVWEPQLARVKSDEVKADLQRFYDRAMMIAAKHLLIGSPLLWIGMLLTALCLAASSAAMGVRQLLKTAALKVMVGPLDQKHIEDEAFMAMA